jgi:hypothetical protein
MLMGCDMICMAGASMILHPEVDRQVTLSILALSQEVSVISGCHLPKAV